MSGISIDIKIDDREVQDFLSRRQAKARNMRPAFKNIGEYMLRRTEERFEGEHDPEGKPWEPHSPVTLGLSWRLKGKKTRTKRGKETKAFGRYKEKRKILTDTHNLRNRIVYKAGRNKVAVGTSVIYARIQFLGGKAGRGRKVKIPPRQALGANDEDKREFVEIIKNYLL